MTFLRKSNFPFTAGRQHFTPIYEQSKYKFLVYIDGHCPACRYGFMMRLGAVILKVESRQVADRMWYFPLLEPYVDHVPVKADLSDLEEKIRWCRENDDQCRQIAANCQAKYGKYVARPALLDYIEMVTKHIAKRHVEAPTWWNPPPPELAPPKGEKPEQKCHFDQATRTTKLCCRCQEEIDEEQRELKAKKKENANRKRHLAKRRAEHRRTMIKRSKKTTES